MANVSATRRMCNPVEPNALALQANWLWTGSDSFFFFLFLLQFKTQFVELIASPTAAKSFLFSTSCVACSPNFKNICQTRTCFIYFGFSRYCACCCFRSYCCCCCSCCCCCCMPMGDNVNGKCWALAPWSIVNNNCLLGIEHEPSSIWDYAASPVAVYLPVCRPSFLLEVC